MDLLVNAIKEFVLTEGLARKYLLAYSGGLDSHVLLHAFATVRLTHPLHFSAIYINHGIHSQASEWAKHCAHICAELNVDFIQQKIQPVDRSHNLEEHLRNHRYQIFKNKLETNGILLTAHHQNDQAETILLQLCRGAGLQGLAAMPRIKSFGMGFHARPLLDFTRDDLLHYANLHQLQWIEDDSNFNSEFTRNFLRHEVMPVLTKRWPSVTKTLARSAKNCADAYQFITSSTDTLIENTRGSIDGTLSVKKLLLLNANEQKHALRAWIYQSKFLLPSSVKMQHILQTCLHAREDKMPHVKWGNAEIRRYRDNLFLMSPIDDHDSDQIISWQLSKPLTLPPIGTLKAVPMYGQGLRSDIHEVTVQFRQGGETIRLPGRQHHHELKKIFQMWGILPWQRDRIPLIYVEDKLAAIAGFMISDEFIASPREPGLNILIE